MATTDPNVDLQQPPEKRHKGRLPGAVARYSKSSVQRLQELGFDPIQKLVQLYEDITKEIAELDELKMNPKMLKNGDVRRYSSMAHAQLITTQQKLINDLMRYGYARVPETVNVKPELPSGITINLTPKGGQFVAEDVVDITPEDPEDE